MIRNRVQRRTRGSGSRFIVWSKGRRVGLRKLIRQKKEKSQKTQKEKTMYPQNSNKGSTERRSCGFCENDKKIFLEHIPDKGTFVHD
jgi:hypothetical protein